MPVMDGWEATKVIRVRQASQKMSTPIKTVALSAHVMEAPKEGDRVRDGSVCL